MRETVRDSAYLTGTANVGRVLLAALRCLLPPNSTSEPLLAFQRSLLEPWQELWLLIREYRRLPETFRYLAAWFIMSDAFATITSTAVLFAKTTLGMPASSLIWIGVL